MSTTNTWFVWKTLFKNQFIGKIVVKSGQLFDSVQKAVHFEHQNRGMDIMPSNEKKRFLRKKYKKHLLSSIQKTKLTQTSESALADRTEKIKKSQFELEVIKFVD